MSRIRSIHPGLFTDPEFLQASMAARLLLLGLWTECDDRGVFEWKPLALKIKLFPVDNVDVEALLVELQGADRLRKVDLGGKPYGICRNFCRYQRPKNPAQGHQFSAEWAAYVHLLPEDNRFKGIVLPQPSPTPTPALPQEGVKMPPDGEERNRREKKESAPAALDPDFEAFWSAYPKKADRGHALKAFRIARKRGIEAETLTVGAKRYRDDPQRKPEFTKNGATWLNGECWRDEAAQPPARPKVIGLDF